jgi:hypothetical protein
MRHKDLGLGSNLQLGFSPTNHKGLDSIYVTVIRGGKPVVVTDWSQLPKD